MMNEGRETSDFKFQLFNEIASAYKEGLAMTFFGFFAFRDDKVVGFAALEMIHLND